MSEPELTPEQEATVRRLLSDAAPPAAPLPPDVATRLDDVLAGLLAERAAGPDRPASDDAVVVPLRRRRWPQLLVAAAAVSLVGLVAPGLVQQAGDDEQTATEGAFDAGGSASTEDTPAAPEGARLPKPPGSPAEKGEDAVRSSGKLAADTAVRGSLGLLPGTIDNADAYVVRPGAPCATPGGLSGRVYQVRLGEDRRAVVVLRPLQGTAARADVYPCGQTVLPVASRLVLGVAAAAR